MTKRKSDRCLYVIQNTFCLMEACSVRMPSADDSLQPFFTLNPHYLKSEESRNEMQEFISRIFPSVPFMRFDNCIDEKWNTIIMPSYIYTGKSELLSLAGSADIILVEEGSFDYVGDGSFDAVLYEDTPLYLFSPELASPAARKAELHKLAFPQSVVDLFERAFTPMMENIAHISPNAPILYTAPLAEDYGADKRDMAAIVEWLERKYDGQTVIVKRHPRDSWEYNSNKISFVDCDKKVPGQLLSILRQGADEIYMSASTLLNTLAKSRSKICVINTLPDNKEYTKQLDYISSDVPVLDLHADH